MLSLSASSAGLNSRTQILCVNRGNEFFLTMLQKIAAEIMASQLDFRLWGIPFWLRSATSTDKYRPDTRQMYPVGRESTLNNYASRQPAGRSREALPHLSAGFRA